MESDHRFPTMLLTFLIENTLLNIDAFVVRNLTLTQAQVFVPLIEQFAGGNNGTLDWLHAKLTDIQALHHSNFNLTVQAKLTIGATNQETFMHASHLTDQEINHIALAHAAKLREDLLAKRQAAIMEEEMTDAGKAEPASRTVNLKLSVCAEPAAGKTSLLLFLLDKLADAGLMSSADTKTITLDPHLFISSTRIDNTDKVETLTLDLDLGLITPTGEVPGKPRLSDNAYLDGTFAIERSLLSATPYPVDVLLAALRTPMEEAFATGFAGWIDELNCKVRLV